MSAILYGNPILNYSPYSSDIAQSTEIDLRKEMTKLIHEEKRGTWIIYRRVKMENGIPKKCICRTNNRSGEPDKDIACKFCGGLGYYYTDILGKTYINHSQAYAIYEKFKQEGTSKVDYRTMYMEYDFIKKAIPEDEGIPTRFDRIIELELDMEGNLISPTKPRELYDILSVDPYRLDNMGRIEYYRFRIISIVDKSFLV